MVKLNDRKIRWIIHEKLRGRGAGEIALQSLYFTRNNHRYHFDIEAKRRFLDHLRERFNAGTKYNGRALKWDTIIERKVVKLSRFLTAKTRRLDFSEPSPSLHRIDNIQLRRRILCLSQPDAVRLGIGKSTLYYLRKNARGDRRFMIHEKVRTKLSKAGREE